MMFATPVKDGFDENVIDYAAFNLDINLTSPIKVPPLKCVRACERNEITGLIRVWLSKIVSLREEVHHSAFN